MDVYLVGNLWNSSDFYQVSPSKQPSMTLCADRRAYAFMFMCCGVAAGKLARGS